MLFIANSVSGFAQGISIIAIPWYFADVLEQPRFFGIAYAVITFLSIFWSLYCGTLIDKYSRKKIFLWLNISGGLVLSAVTAVGFYMGYVPVFLVLTVFTATIFIFNVHYPNLYAFGQEITLPQNYSRINSYIEIQGQLTSIIAGALAAIFLTGVEDGTFNMLGAEITLPITFTAFHLHEIFLINAITYFLALIFIALIKYNPVTELNAETGNILKRLKGGFNFLLKHPYIFAFGMASYSIFVLIIVNLFFLLPVYVRQHLNEGAGVFASGEMVYAFGAVLAGIFVPVMLRNMKPVSGIIINILVTTGLMVVMFFNIYLGIFYTVMVILGLTNAGTRIMRLTYLFSHVPNNVIGRVNSVFSVLSIMLRIAFIGMFSLPFFTDGDNIRYAYLIFGIFIFVAAMVMFWVYPKLHGRQNLKG